MSDNDIYILGIWDAFALGFIAHWITTWPIWSKLWMRFNNKLDEWADV